jgi:hypothetical protein
MTQSRNLASALLAFAVLSTGCGKSGDSTDGKAPDGNVVVLGPLTGSLVTVTLHGVTQDERKKFMVASFAVRLTPLGEHIVAVAKGNEKPRDGLTRSQYAALVAAVSDPLADDLTLIFHLVIDGEPESTVPSLVNSGFVQDDPNNRTQVTLARRPEFFKLRIPHSFRGGWSVGVGWASFIGESHFRSRRLKKFAATFEKLGLSAAAKAEAEMLERIEKVEREKNVELGNLRERDTNAQVRTQYRFLARAVAESVRAEAKSGAR